MKQITVAEAIQRTVEHREVFHDEMLHIMRQIMRGELTPAQIGGFIVGLRVKKETIGEIAAAAQVMREFATPVRVADTSRLVDTCGTGDDAAHTFNVSTASAFVATAARARVAAASAGGERAGRGRRDHGPAPSHARGRGRAVPSGGPAHRARPQDPGEFP